MASMPGPKALRMLISRVSSVLEALKLEYSWKEGVAVVSASGREIPEELKPFIEAGLVRIEGSKRAS
jgi:hypothetical protein